MKKTTEIFYQGVISVAWLWLGHSIMTNTDFLLWKISGVVLMLIGGGHIIMTSIYGIDYSKKKDEQMETATKTENQPTTEEESRQNQ